MSLDVYLLLDGAPQRNNVGSGIFVREGGATVEITRAEWDARNPGIEPVVFTGEADLAEAYSRNITHNLGKMADAAGIYGALWRPDENEIETAGQLIEPLTIGLHKLRKHPEEFQHLNPANGWGSYDALVEFVDDYLKACVRFPAAKVRVSR